jgi:hypothetical protein
MIIAQKDDNLRSWQVSLQRFKRILVTRAEPKDKCDICSYPANRLYRHKIMCPTIKEHGRLFPVFWPQCNLLLCQFGCPYKGVTQRDVLMHLYENHTDAELDPWGMNRGILKYCIEVVPISDEFIL